jgi:16S rRNA (adenine1518-N6/adenine1519-N6)-dimethyltransferase
VRRRFAQHFLEAAWVRKLVEVIQPEPSDVVLEIGPGRGALTLALAPRVAALAAIEIDRDLAAALRRRQEPRVQIIEGDVLRIDLERLVTALLADAGGGVRLRIVGNLPYNISSPILFRLMALARAGAPVSDATVMLQREVADRVVAQPGSGDWGPLAIAIQLRAQVTRLLALPPGAFRPQPKVHSAVVRLAFRDLPPWVAHPAELDTIVRAVFGQRRKTMLNALRPLATTMGRDAARVLAAAGIDSDRRPQTLNLPDYARLADAWEDPGVRS